MTTTYTVNSQTVRDGNGAPICIVDSVTENVTQIAGSHAGSMNPISELTAIATFNDTLNIHYNGRHGYGYMVSSSVSDDSDWLTKKSYSITYDVVPINLGLRTPHGFTNKMGLTSLTYSTTFDEPTDIRKVTLGGQKYVNKPATVTFSAQWSCRETNQSATDNASDAKEHVYNLENWPEDAKAYKSYLIGASSNFSSNGQCNVSKTYYLIPSDCAAGFASEQITASSVGSPQKFTTTQYTTKITGFSTIEIDAFFQITSVNPASVAAALEEHKRGNAPGIAQPCTTTHPALPGGDCEVLKSTSVSYNYSEPSASMTRVYTTEPLNCDKDGYRREWSKASYTNQRVYVEMFGWNNTNGKSIVQNFNVDKNPKTEYMVTVSDVSSCGTGAGLKREAEAVFNSIYSGGGTLVSKVLSISDNRATIRATEQS